MGHSIITHVYFFYSNSTLMKYVCILMVFAVLSGCINNAQTESSPSTFSYEANWESLHQYEIPEWFNDAKLGIFIHWGPYAVPAYRSEWYPRLMYMDTATFSAQLKLGAEGPNKVYTHHKANWGDQKQFGYKDFIPMFKAEKFDAQEWIKIFKEAGARYVVPVAEHHDGFAMYASQHTRWNAIGMGPQRDILGELFEAGRAEGLKMGASTHFAFNWAYYNKKPHFDTSDPEYNDLYSKKGPAVDEPVSEAFKELWWNRTTDIIDQYQPDLIWFDFFWDQPAFEPYHPKLAAYYYNKGLEWGKEVVLQDKNFHHEYFPEGTFVHDLERGKMAGIKKYPWQTDTSIGKNSWGYVTDWISKDANSLIDDLIDIVSKNGCMLLNVGPKADGTIPKDQQKILQEIGSWLKMNGEAIYDTRCYKVFGEGPTEVSEGYMSERKKDKAFSEKDIRFTTKGNTLYAFILKAPSSGEVLITSLKKGEESLQSIEMLGSGASLSWSQEEDGLHVILPQELPGKHAWALAMRMD